MFFILLGKFQSTVIIHTMPHTVHSIQTYSSKNVHWNMTIAVIRHPKHIMVVDTVGARLQYIKLKILIVLLGVKHK